MRFWSVLILAAMTLLAGCEETSQPQARSGGVVGPGSALPDPVMASLLFADICAETLPWFSQARAKIKALPFDQNPQTGTFYHRNLDLSVKLGRDTTTNRKHCSMVFAGRAKNNLQIAIGFSAAVSAATDSGQIGIDPVSGTAQMDLPGGAKFQFIEFLQAGGRTYFRAVVFAR